MKPLILVLFLGFSMARAEERPLATFRVDSMSTASCLPSVSDVNAVNSRHHLHWVRWFGNGGAGDHVARILAEVERLYGKPFPGFVNFALDVDPSFRILGLQSFDKDLKRQKVTVTESENVALLAHEMGHLVGNSPRAGEATWYDAYFAAVSPCHFTEYAAAGADSGKRNEEFAEVFAAYITGSRTLRKKCPEAYDFMRKVLFPKAAPRCLK